MRDAERVRIQCDRAARAAIHLQEATIGSIHAAFTAGQLTCTQLTRLYLDRIEVYDPRGPALHAIITVNPKAMVTAAELDRQYEANRSGTGALHRIPIVLKDNFNTFDMPTTGLFWFAEGRKDPGCIGSYPRGPWRRRLGTWGRWAGEVMPPRCTGQSVLTAASPRNQHS